MSKVADERLGGTEEIQTVEGQTAVYGSRARTLVDAVYDWSRFNSLPRAYDWIRGKLAASRVDAAGLVAVALRYGDKETIRRIGALLEMQCVEMGLLRKLEKILEPSTSLIPWIPTKPKRGKINRRLGYVPALADDGDELYPNGIFVFNITKMIEYIRGHKDEMALESIVVKAYHAYAGDACLACAQKLELT